MDGDSHAHAMTIITQLKGAQYVSTFIDNTIAPYHTNSDEAGLSTFPQAQSCHYMKIRVLTFSRA